MAVVEARAALLGDSGPVVSLVAEIIWDREAEVVAEYRAMLVAGRVIGAEAAASGWRTIS